MSESELTLNQVRWMARRGMLELDLLLNYFIDQCYEDLTSQHKNILITLLQEEDPTLHSWFFSSEVSNNKEFAMMVSLIKQCQAMKD